MLCTRLDNLKKNIFGRNRIYLLHQRINYCTEKWLTHVIEMDRNRFL